MLLFFHARRNVCAVPQPRWELWHWEIVGEEEEDGSVVRAPGESSQVTAVTPVGKQQRVFGGQGKQEADQLCSQVYPNPD